MSNDEWKQEWKRVGRLAAARRRDLGLTQKQVSERGGPSEALVRAVERGTYSASMQGTVKRGYESALQWEPFTIDNMLLDKADPVPLPEDSFRPRLANVRPDRDSIDEVSVRSRREPDGSWTYVGESGGHNIEGGAGSQIRVEFRPGAGRKMWAGDLVQVVGDAHRQALRLTTADENWTEDRLSVPDDLEPRVSEREGGDGNADNRVPGGSAPIVDDEMSDVDDELPAAAKEGSVEEPGEFNT